MKHLSFFRIIALILLLSLSLGALSSCFDFMGNTPPVENLSECEKNGHTKVDATCTDFAFCSGGRNSDLQNQSH